MITDLVANALTMIRNACMRKKEKVDIPASGILKEVARILKEENFIKDIRLIEDGKQGLIRLYLKYGAEGDPAITQIKRVSRPGLRTYKRKDEIPPALSGLGITILSTSKGVMTDKQAENEGIGGEIICQVW
jgi:small subunit ribosomal protein S8